MDGQENTWSNIYGQKFFEVQDGVTETNHGVIDYLVVTTVDWLDSLDADVRDQFLTIVNEVTRPATRIRRGQPGGQAGDHRRRWRRARADAEQRQAWVEAMKPVWDQFKDDVGQENIDAAQAINASI